MISDDYPQRTKELLSPATPLSRIAEAVSGTPRQEQDDVMRMLFFHTNSFRESEEDLKDITNFLATPGDIGRRRKVVVSWTDDSSRERKEKALHRLLLIGVVADYTVDFGSRESGVHRYHLKCKPGRDREHSRRIRWGLQQEVRTGDSEGIPDAEP